ALAHILVQTALRRIAFELFAETLAKSGAGIVVGGKLVRGQEPYLLDLVNAALGVHVKGANAVDLVVEQIDAVGQRTAHREKVDDAAAETEFSGRNHLGDVRVARQRQLRSQRVRIEVFPLFEEKRVGRQEGHGGQTI